MIILVDSCSICPSNLTGTKSSQFSRSLHFYREQATEAVEHDPSWLGFLGGGTNKLKSCIWKRVRCSSVFGLHTISFLEIEGNYFVNACYLDYNSKIQHCNSRYSETSPPPPVAHQCAPTLNSMFEGSEMAELFSCASPLTPHVVKQLSLFFYEELI
ncbi:Hypothetical predicted protein [Podarcis lilfordi]|uniref:Uncharacterized protein n=1 Tax=Podarcis lilfordi TaxID=74358 RepID=A0AA35P8E0_9SAUR|nr:Hypothetical predicted protein [Podarcis lilfordi]